MNISENNISARQAHDWLSSGEAVLIDVRESDEFKSEHIPYAFSLPLACIGNMQSFLNIPEGQKIIFQCQRGMRGQKACAICAEHGSIQPVYNIEGGIEAWKSAALPVIGSGSKGLSIFRQVQMIVGSLVLLFACLGVFGGVSFALPIVAILGGALAFAGVTGWCGLAMLLSRAPWNKF